MSDECEKKWKAMSDEYDIELKNFKIYRKRLFSTEFTHRSSLIAHRFLFHSSLIAFLRRPTWPF
jgi:hypothetical protein